MKLCSQRSQAKKQATRKVFADMMRRARGRPFMVLEPDAGDDHAEGEVVSYAAGAGYVVGGLNNRDQPLAATARLPGKYHVYDVRTHEYQGLVDAWQVRMKPGTAALYACLPYAVSAIVAEPASARARMGDLWQGKFSIKRNPSDASSAPHAIRIQVLQPDNKPRPEYAEFNLQIPAWVVLSALYVPA